jgi:type I restriction enzyme, S subunit
VGTDGIARDTVLREKEMSTDFLFEQFATLATAPEGIARLRELILQLAVQGKLGTNNPTELPLKIDESKKRFRKVKSQDGDSSKTQIIDIFPPDSMPMNWRKTTLGSIGIWSTGGTPSRQVSNYFDGGIPWIKSGDLNDGIVTKTDETISQLGLDNSNAKLLPKGTISIALYGATIGKLGILGIESTTNQACANCVINEKIITTRYLFYFLRSQKSYFIQVGQGGAQPNITNWIIWEWPIVIPPLTEQHRIIEKIDRLMALCDELEALQKQERGGCFKLGTASLTGLQKSESPGEFGLRWAQVFDAFEMILDCPENVVLLQQTILQLAIKGKLATQDAGDETASVLLEKIRKEIQILENKGLVKPEKPLELINDDNLPFKIPKQWKWVRLGDIAIVTDRDHRTPVYHCSGIPLISPNVFTKDGIDFRNPKYVDEEELRLFRRKCNPQKGDILYSRIGAIIGEARLVNFDKDYVALHSLASIKPISPFVNSEFLCKILSSNFVKTQGYYGVKSVGVPDLGLSKMKNFLIPLPPLAEQHRIVAKVDVLMKLCDALESQLKERAGVQGRLAMSIVKEVAGGA